jgi:hypothetical protein
MNDKVLFNKKDQTFDETNVKYSNILVNGVNTVLSEDFDYIFLVNEPSFFIDFDSESYSNFLILMIMVRTLLMKVLVIGECLFRLKQF